MMSYRQFGGMLLIVLAVMLLGMASQIRYSNLALICWVGGVITMLLGWALVLWGRKGGP